MAQKAIREYFGKKLLFNHLSETKYQGQAITTEDLLSQGVKLPQFTDGFVAKPDELFGKRGKNNLVFIGKTEKQTIDWLRSKAGKTITIEQNGKTTTGVLNHFLVEPYIPHQQEFYLAIKTQRKSDKIFFSVNGGIDVEENWELVNEFEIPFQLGNTSIKDQIQDKIAQLMQNEKDGEKLSVKITDFISSLYQAFKQLNFTYVEINPFVFKDDELHILDLVARLDDTAWYQNYTLWSQSGEVEFPASFGSSFSKSELKIMDLDSKSGASLKYKLLNPDGKIWLLTSGGGGSVIFADTVGDLGYHNEIANYCDYSGNPNTEETREFCESLFVDMLSGKSKQKILIIAGGIANFTDVAKTFAGVGQAIEKSAKEFQKQGIKIYVRRGGPNYKKGLEYMKNLGNKYGIQTEVFGPEMYMTEVVKLALA